MRSRCAWTTSTGDTFFVAIMRASSVMDVQQSSLTGCPRSEEAELRGRLGFKRNVAHRGEPAPSRLDEREQRGQLRVGELEPLRLGKCPQRIDGELFHAGRIAHNPVHAHTRSRSIAVVE